MEGKLWCLWPFLALSPSMLSLLHKRKQRPQDPILMPMPTLIMDTGEVMEDWDGEDMVDMVDTIDHGDMGIGDVRRGQLMMKKQLLDPMLTLMLMLGMATMVMVWDMDMDMVDITDHGDMATGDVRRGPLMSQPSPDLILMLMPMLMLGMVTMAMVWDMDMAWDMDMVDTTDHGDMDTGEERRGQLMLMPTMATGEVMEDGD